MKIIFSPSKDMIFDKSVNNGEIKLNSKTEEILKVIGSLSKDDLQKALKVNDDIFENVNNYYENIKKGPFYEGLNLYNGMSFKELNRDFTLEERNYLSDHLLILSALYGPIKPFDLISPYRLDMNAKIKVNNNNLKKFWKDYFNSKINNNEIVFNLASDEFSSLFERDNYNFVDFSFYKENNGELKTHSTTSKKSRGKMLNFLYKNKIESIDELREKEVPGLRLKEEMTDNNKFVYILED